MNECEFSWAPGQFEKENCEIIRENKKINEFSEKFQKYTSEI